MLLRRFPYPVRWQNYTEPFARLAVFLYTRSTLIAAFFNTVGTLFGALLGGYALARLLFKGGTDLFSFSNQAS